MPSLSPARAVMGIFFLHGMILANWFPRIPEVQEALGIGTADLAIALSGMPVGTFIALPLAGRAIEHLTARRVIAYGFVIYCAALALTGWSWSIPSLFMIMLVIGASYPVVDVSMNVEANRIEQTLGRKIMITCHAFWSLGSMVGALSGVGFAALAIDVGWHLLIVGIVSLPLALFFTQALPHVPHDIEARQAKQPVFALPNRALVGLCLYAIGIIMVEVTARNWSAVYLDEVLAASPAVAGLAYGAFMFCMSVGRFLGDWLNTRYGPVTLARACGFLMVAGEVIVVAAPNPLIAIAGFAAAGLGVSVAFPLMMTASASRGGRPAATNVAAIALAVSFAFLVGSPLIGFLGEAWGLRIGLLVIIPAGLMSLALAGELQPDHAPTPRHATS
jgi:MFS family permease